MKIIHLKTEHLENNCITDAAAPRFSFAFTTEKKNASLVSARIRVGDWEVTTTEQTLIPYAGAPLAPFTRYEVTVEAEDNYGEHASASMSFETGRRDLAWRAKWITDGAYRFTEKKVSPKPMLFRRHIVTKKKISRAFICATALGIYGLDLNGKRVGDDYFAPGFTSYKSQLQYQLYDVTSLLTGDDVLTATVSGGWAVGSFVFTRKNRITCDRQALLAELVIRYADGTEEIVGTDESWEVTVEGPLRAADLYDGEVYDGTVELSALAWRRAAIEKVKISPHIELSYGAPVRVLEERAPISCKQLTSGELVYDFGQNFAGVISARICGEEGRTVLFRHAEVLRADGSPNDGLLRSAKAKAVYICRDGEQTYSPRYTYMGFRYVGVSGVRADEIELKALVLSSDIPQNGSFTCSDEKIDKLQSNLIWSARSNFIDIPTDCPQRDERMGWTGDIALFAPTACYNFDMARFLEKWLRDVRAEQLKSGGLPNTVPVQGYGFPATMPKMAIDFWGDACILVPWAEYLARGDRELLERSYDSMKRYNKACAFWAGLLSVGKHRYIWHTPVTFHFGDWVAPDIEKMSGWQKRSKWTATASFANTSKLLSVIAGILGKNEDAKKYQRRFEKIADAYMKVFTDGKGKLKEEFQTAYVLPLQFGMFPENVRKKAAENLAALIQKNNYAIGTGFPGTPYVLFALADNGQEETAFKMLMNTACPSWLYEVEAGGTTIWERWDAMREDGSPNAVEDGRGGMISFNHYAGGAVGDFLYRRIAGIEPVTCGYRTSRIKPLVGGGLTSAEGRVGTPYGELASSWRTEGGKFFLRAEVPAGTECEICLPDGHSEKVGSGIYEFSCNMKQDAQTHTEEKHETL